MYRAFRTPSIWREMDRFQRDMNRFMNRYGTSDLRGAPSYPAVNIWTSEDGQFISAEMPGLSSEDIDINVQGDTLTISGKRDPEDLPEGAHYHRQERGYGKFTRSIRLPYAVDSEKTEAQFKDGVLAITLPRPEVDKPQKISIKS